MALSFLKGMFQKNKKEFNYEDTIDENNVITRQISPDSIQITEDYVRSGSNYTRTLVAVEFEPILNQDNIRRISEISETISIVQYLDFYEPSQVRKELSKSIDQNKSKLKEEKLSSYVKAKAQVEIEDAEMLLQNLARNSERMFMFQFLIHIVSSSLDELESVTSLVKSEVASIAKLNFPKTRAKDAFDSFLPINKNKVYDLTYRPMNSEAVSFFFPFHENEIYDENGIILGSNMDTNNIIMVNDETYLNKHAVYIGTTGSGKSTAMFSNMMRKYMFGNRIIVIDPKGEFGNVLKRMGGEWVKFSLEGGSIINPFDLPVRSFEDNNGSLQASNPLFDKVSTLITFFQLMYSNMTDLQADVLSEILLELYADERFGKSVTKNTDSSLFLRLENTDYPTMENLYNLLSEKAQNNKDQYKIIADFHQTLRAYAVGAYSNVFNGYTNVDVNNDLISYDLFSVYKNDRLVKPLYFLLLSSLRNEILNGDKAKTQLYIDEAHIIADPKVTVAMEFLYEMMKVVRSFNCGITTATQQIQDFMSAKDANRNYGDAVIALSMQQIILPMQKKEVMFVNNEMLYDFSEDDINFLEFSEADRKKKAGKGFLFVGSRKIKIHVELTDLEAKLWLDKDYSALEI
ncbi:uncharacterized protein DUF87 [Scopulibacillus darangshiensis]|uniref:Uncharacterized protein DUF87 n=1 Tax=Scopulibacillus darangshiensis TaxID=442528 RepID=A0A4R2NSN6_9BACL|nr:DUF87 domain-containing protein [Scopulibacillus darangshiensis]TCP24448.1 uncharacterized protein DUF87 [Scopulibacillus darangshiensis]